MKTLIQVRDSLLSVYERDRNGTAGDKYRSDWAKQLADDIDAHLSAQAKVRVTDEDVDLAKQAAYDLGDASAITDRAMRSALESFAARLSQGVQGEAVFRYPKKPLPRAHGYLDKSGVEWAAYDTTQMEAYARQAVAENTHPAERAAVPDGWRETIQEAIDCIADVAQFKGSLKIGIYRHIGGKLRALLTAAPQPPEGARVVIDAKYDNVLVPFVSLMVQELHANSHKGDRPSWLQMKPDECLFEIYYHMAKLTYAAKKGNAEEAREFAADVANMCMMLMDICGVLEVK